MSTQVILKEQEKKLRAQQHYEAPKQEKKLEDTKPSTYVKLSTIACGDIEPGTTTSHDSEGHKINYGLGFTPEHRHLTSLPTTDNELTFGDPIFADSPPSRFRAEPSHPVLGTASNFHITYRLTSGGMTSLERAAFFEPSVRNLRAFENEYNFSFVSGDHQPTWTVIGTGIPQIESPYYTPEENDPEWRKKIDPRLMDISPQWYDEMMDRSSGERTLRQIALQTPKITSGNLGDSATCIVGQAFGNSSDYWNNCSTCRIDSNNLPNYAYRNDTTAFVNTVNHFVEHFHNIHKSHVPDFRAVMR